MENLKTMRSLNETVLNVMMNNVETGQKNVDETEIDEAKEMNTDNVQKALQHDCAKHVVHEDLGYGVCIRDSHIMEENEDGTGTVTHYDVIFENGIRYDNIPVEDLKVTFFESHMGSGKKKKK